jgi:molecular chaperone GrpE (heat shock protein)
MPELPQPSPSHEKPELSLTAKELMKLSDWVLLAKADGTAVRPKVLEEIYRQLTAILAKENVTLLLETNGPCDYERQMVVGTQPTDDPSLNDCVHSTVRPGYLFHQQLIRPQEVIIYTH